MIFTNWPKPESFTFFKCWNPIFDWRNCSNLEICGNDWSPSEHCIWIWIIEDIIYLHFLMNNFCKSLHIFSLWWFQKGIVRFFVSTIGDRQSVLVMSQKNLIKGWWFLVKWAQKMGLNSSPDEIFAWREAIIVSTP